MSEHLFGFTWGPMNVHRLASIKERRFLGVKTEYHAVEIAVSPTGRSVRVWIDGKEVTR